MKRSDRIAEAIEHLRSQSVKIALSYRRCLINHSEASRMIYDRNVIIRKLQRGEYLIR